MKVRHVFSLFVVGSLASACAAGASGGPNNADAALPAGSCPPTADIEDGENADDQVIVQEGRAGWLYTYADESGSTIDPSGGAFTLAPRGANGSRYAMRMKGKLATGGEVYAGMGFSFVDPKGPYDASQYKGVVFFAKKGEGSTTGSVTFKIPDANTAPEGGVCTECYNDFGVGFDVADEWTRYVVMFSDLKQGSGWGNPQPPALDAAKVFGMQWQVATPGAEYDIWVDDVSFFGCD